MLTSLDIAMGFFGISIFVAVSGISLIYCLSPDYSQIKWCDKCGNDIDIFGRCECKGI